MPYIGKSPHFGVRNRFLFVADASDTSVSGADANGATLTFTDGAYVDVYLNGVLLKAGTDYNTNTANTIAGLSALSANDEVTVVVYDVFTVADTVSATSGGTFSGAVTLSGGVSSSLTVANNLTLTNGDIIFGTSGNGINLGVTSNTDSNTLDDYEEGLWDATLEPQTSGSVSISNNACQYTKIGSMVYLSGSVQTNSASSPVGVMKLGGFPYAISNLTDLAGRSIGTINIQAAAITPVLYGLWLEEGDSFGLIYNFSTSSEQPAGTAANNFSGNETIYFSAIYRTT